MSLPNDGRDSEKMWRSATTPRPRAMPAVKHDLAKLYPVSAKQNIIWIASYPKSGNTWVRVFLHNVIRQLRGETEGAQDINDLGRYAIWEHSYPHYTQVLGKSPAYATPEEIARARPLVQALISSGQPGLSLAKTHLCFGSDHDIPTVNLSVTLGAIYIVRNPLDVAISYAHHCSRPIDTIVDDMATQGFRTGPSGTHVGDVLGSWSQHVASWMGISSRPVHIIRYEDMLNSPVKTFTSLVQFLSLRCDAGQIQKAIDKSSFSELSNQEARAGFAEKPQNAEKFFRSGEAGQWKHHLGHDLLEKILSHHAPMMQRAGYLPPSIGRIDRELLLKLKR